MIKNKKQIMKTIKLFTILIISSLISLSYAFAAGDEAKTTVEKTVNEVQQIVRDAKPGTAPEKIDTDLRAVIAPVFDFQEMSKRCLGVNWKDATPQEQVQFTELFSNLLAKNYLKQIRLTAATSDYHVTASNQEDAKAVVQTKVINEKGTLKIDYRLYNKGQDWKVYDVIIENIGLVSNYRSEFTEIIQKEKVAGLIKQLENKVKSNKEAEKES